VQRRRTRTAARGTRAGPRRKSFVEEQLRARDIRDARVLDAILEVPWHLFVPEPQRLEAHAETIEFSESLAEVHNAYP
jgi:protein-L-isoaspartate O-methyltransferase